MRAGLQAWLRKVLRDPAAAQSDDVQSFFESSDPGLAKDGMRTHTHTDTHAHRIRDPCVQRSPTTLLSHSRDIALTITVSFVHAGGGRLKRVYRGRLRVLRVVVALSRGCRGECSHGCR